jgi:large subunit ribosomal protein L4
VQVPVYNLTGEVVKNIEVSDRVFGQAMNEAVLHQALVRQQADARQGTASTKTRGEVQGSTRKLYRQKHTGMARRGSRRSPLLRGGGKVFGPLPRDYRQDMPKKMRQLALRCVLSDKREGGELKIVEQFGFTEPKTRQMLDVLTALKTDYSTLVVTSEVEENVIKSARNLTGVKTLPANLLNVVDLLSYRGLLMTEAAVRKAEQIWGKEASQGAESAAV